MAQDQSNGAVIRVGEGTLKEFRYGIELIKTNPAPGGPDAVYVITEYVQRFQLIESMFHKALALDMTFVDGGGFYDKIGIAVNDRVRVRLFKENVPNAEFRSIDTVFHLSEIGSAATTINAKMRSFLISGTSVEAHLNAKLRVRRPIRGTPQSIASTIISGWLSNEIKLADSSVRTLASPQLQILFPSCNPFRALEMATARAKAQSPRAGANVQCFKSIDGPMVFMSLKEIVASGKLHQYKFIPNTLTSNSDADYFRFSVFKQHKHASAGARLEEGMLVGEHVEFNMITREFSRTTFRFKDQHRELMLTGEYPAFDYDVADQDYVAELGAAFGNSIGTTYRHSDEAFGAAEDTISTSSVYDKAQKASLASIAYSAEVMGNSDIRAGDLIEVVAPAAYQSDISNEPDVFLSGKFLVGSVRHVVVDAENYMTFVDLFKDGYDLPPGDNQR